LNEEKNISRDLVKGIFLLLIGASMLGGSGIFVKLSDSSPSLIAFYRSLFALPFLYAWMKFEERNDSSKIIWDKRTFFFLVLGGLCFALDMSIWNWSLTFTSVANATLMANIAPVFVVIFGVLFLGYKIEIFFVVTLLLARRANNGFRGFVGNPSCCFLCRIYIIYKRFDQYTSTSKNSFFGNNNNYSLFASH
jgi:EamA domain-containing membrane protein RarD